MKKIVSAMALCMALLGAVMMVTGCGSKPKADTVWKVEKMSVSGASAPMPAEVYLCFHSDGNAYSATKMFNLQAKKLGAYTIEKKNFIIEKVSVPYTLKGEKMTLDLTEDFAKELGIPSVAGAAKLELQKVSSPTAAEIKKAAE